MAEREQVLPEAEQFSPKNRLRILGKLYKHYLLERRADDIVGYGRNTGYYCDFYEFCLLEYIREDFMVRYCGSEGLNFPNGESLGKFLAQLGPHWYNSRTSISSLDLAHFKTWAEQSMIALNYQQLPVRLFEVTDWNWKQVEKMEEAVRLDEDWLEKWTAPGRAMYQAAKNSQRELAFMHAQRMAGWRDGSWPAARAAVQACGWIVVEDLMPQHGYNQGNPFIPLIEIMRRGGELIGPVQRRTGLFGPQIKELVISYRKES